MAKKKGFLGLLRRVFVSEVNTEKKDKTRKWVFWRLKIKKRVPSIRAPSPSELRDRTENEATTEEQNEHDITDVIEVVDGNSPRLARIEHEQEHAEEITENADADPQFEDQISKKNQTEERAVIKIQTAFRAYLARKALRALKGIVKLQAYIRGRAVRRQAMTTLKCLQSVVSIQSQFCARRTHNPGGAYLQSDETKEFQALRDKIIKVDTNSQKRWDDSLMTKEEAEAMLTSKKEAAIKRERIREYIIAHRNSAESYQRRSNTRFKYWLDQWVDTQLFKSKELEDLDLSSNLTQKDEIFRDRQLKIPTGASPGKIPRHRRQFSVGEQSQNLVNLRSPVPTYMAATKSAKAKTRSSSSPRVRPGSFDTQSESCSPYKNKICLTTSIMSEAPSRVKVGNNTARASAYQQRSPSLRGFNTGPMKSNRTSLKDLSIDSECSIQNWSKQGGFR